MRSVRGARTCTTHITIWSECGLHAPLGAVLSTVFDVTVIVPGAIGLWRAPVRATFSGTTVGVQAIYERLHTPTASTFRFRRVRREDAYLAALNVPVGSGAVHVSRVGRVTGVGSHLELRGVVRYVAAVAASQREKGVSVRDACV